MLQLPRGIEPNILSTAVPNDLQIQRADTTTVHCGAGNEVCVFLNERKLRAMKDTYFRNWDASDKHITKFAIRLNLEQQDLQLSGITITYVAKNLHYMLVIWESNLFTELMMTEWTSRAPTLCTYTHSIPFFKAKMEALEKYGAGLGGKRKNPFLAAAAAATEIQGELERFVQTISKSNEERALAARETKSEVEGLKEQIRELTSMVRDLAVTVALRPAKSPRQQVEYASDSKTEASEVKQVWDRRRPPPQNTW